MKQIPFNRPFIVGDELKYIQDAVMQGHLAGNGTYTKKCAAWIEEHFKATKVFLTHSGTAALEMAAMLAKIQAGDEVIMPSFTFASTANAFVLRGATPVFADVRSDTLNIDQTQIETLITERTQAIVPVHYAGVACEMDTITDLSRRHDLLIIEDAAQAFDSLYKEAHLGTLGQLGCYSFHETKNLISGEGGALVINDPSMVARAEILWEKGTNRAQMFRGEIDKYTWVDVGSSFLPSELTAAFLYAQLEESNRITQKRRKIWKTYHESLSELETSGCIRLPVIPKECTHCAHMFYILTADHRTQLKLISRLADHGVKAVFHYVPLHSSPMGRKYGRSGPMPVTESIADRLIRLPCYFELEDDEIRFICGLISEFYRTR